MKIKVIDVSKHQGVIDWDKVKADGVQGAILRCGYGDDIVSQDDAQFKRNADECTRLGIPFGVYLYSYAASIKQALSEANHVLRVIKGYKLTYPVFYDLEDPNTTQKCSKSLIGDMAEVFCNTIEDAGYKVGIYANKYWFTSILTDSRFNNWEKWVAQYYKECTYQGKYIGWQYSSTGKVNGIAGNVDMNEFYKNYEDDTTTVPAAPTQSLPDISGYVGTSIVGALNSFGYDSSYAYREKLAAKIGIAKYKGTALQNMDMIQKLGGTIQRDTPKIEYTTYTVKKGDTLSAIAHKYNTTYQKLAQYNRIADPNRIYAGQEIKIPM